MLPKYTLKDCKIILDCRKVYLNSQTSAFDNCLNKATLHWWTTAKNLKPHSPESKF